MKQSFKIIQIFMLVLSVCLISRANSASQDQLENMLNQKTFYTLMSRANEFYNRIMDDASLSENFTYNFIVDEVVTEVRQSKDSNNTQTFLIAIADNRKDDDMGILVLPFGQIQKNRESITDETKLIQRNPEQDAKMPSQIATSKKQLTDQLKSKFEQNINEIINMKQIAQQAFNMVPNLVQSGVVIPLEDILDLKRKVQRILFTGNHNITICNVVNYTDRHKEHQESTGWKMPFLGLISTISQNASYWRQLPHTEKSCRSTINTVQIMPKDTVYVYDLKMLDRSLEDSISTAIATISFDVNNPTTPFTMFDL